MVGTASQDDTVAVVFFKPGQGFFALLLNVMAGSFQLLPCGMGGLCDLFPGHGMICLGVGAECFQELPHQGIGQDLFIGEGQEGIHKVYMFCGNLLHIVFNVLCVGGNHGAVVMVSRIRRLIPLVGDAGIEDKLNAFPDQPGYVSMGDLGRITFGFAGNGFDAQFVNLPGGLGRQYRGKAQLPEENSPERIVFIHIQDSGNAHLAPEGLIGRKGFIVKHPVILIVKKVWNFLFRFILSQTPFAAVSGNELAAAVKLIDSQYTVI